MSDFFSIDIGRKSIKLVQASRDKSGTGKLEAIGSIDFPHNVDTTIPDKKNVATVELIASVIKNLVEASGVKTNQVVGAIPENLIFSKYMTLPVVDVGKLEETIFWAAKQFVPIPMEETQMDWIEIRRSDPDAKGMQMIDLIMIASPKKVVEDYLYLFGQSGLELIALEVESVSIARALTFNNSKSVGTNMFIDIGYNKTNVGVLYNGKLVYSQSIANGSNAFSKIISADFGLQMDQADQYKAAYGLATNRADNGKIANSIRPIMDLIANEVKRVIGFVNTRLNFGTIQTIYLSGGGSMLPGLNVYLKEKMGTQVKYLDPFTNMKLKGEFANIRKDLAVPGFALATGLAIKDE